MGIEVNARPHISISSEGHKDFPNQTARGLPRPTDTFRLNAWLPTLPTTFLQGATGLIELGNDGGEIPAIVSNWAILRLQTATTTAAATATASD